MRVHRRLITSNGSARAPTSIRRSRSERSRSLGLIDAEEVLLKRKRVLGEMLNLSPEEAEQSRAARDAHAHKSPLPPSLAELIADRA